jgi:transposase-like protein
MAVLGDWWAKFKMSIKNWTDLQIQETVDAESVDPLDVQTMDAQLQRVRESLGDTAPAPIENTIRSHLETLDGLLEAPPEDAPDARAAQIKEMMQLPEAYQALRQARWPTGVHCTDCHSNNIRRLPQLPLDSEHNHRYRCLECRLEFNDDAGIIGGDDTGSASISVWMQCWYLMGCTDSLSYIAHCLGVDLHHVEWMVQRLKTILGNYTTPNKLHLTIEADEAQNNALNEQLRSELLAHYEVLNANVSTVPQDTGEYRRQQHLRRHLSASTEPAIAEPNLSSSPKRNP